MLLKNRAFSKLLILVFIFTGASAIYFGCSRKSENDSSANSIQIKAGKELTQKYCGTCHLPVSPEFLDKKTWINNVLPAMAPKLGIGVWRQNRYYPKGESQSKHGVSYEEWINIVHYFEQEAPESLTDAELPVPLKKGWSIFTMNKPQAKDSASPVATTTMVKIDPQFSKIYTSDANENALLQWDQHLDSKKVLSLLSPVVDMKFLDDDNTKRHAVLTSIGTMKAEDISRGIVQEIRLEADTSQSLNVIASELTRPLKTLQGDFNKDGLDDWLICVFGHDTGGLYLYQQEPDHLYTPKKIRGVPGAEDAIVDDFNEDGWPDIMVLFAYDDEGIWMFLNDKDGGFETKNILRFPPIYGSTSFQLIDFNDDGLRDVLFTNGDNADFSQILKPYHGVRIFLNKGNFIFEEAWFYPLNGAMKAIARDFDKDGDLDIATISFFADFKDSPHESFIFFEQTDDLNFQSYALPIHTHGRWLTMDAGDFDNDGDADLVLGNFAGNYISQKNFKPDWDSRTPFVLLLNNSR